MAQKPKGPIYLDKNGKLVGAERRSCREQAAYVAKTLLALVLAIGFACWQKIHTKWDELVDPTVTKKPTDEEVKVETLKNARDGIVISVALGLLVLLVNKGMPTIMVFLGFVVSIVLMVMSCGTIGIIREGVEDYERKIDAAMDGARRIMIGAIAFVLILTALAVGIKEGTILATYFPQLSNFADWQIGKVNELLEFFANFPLKPGA